MINGNLKASYAADEAILNTGWMKLFVYGTMALLALYAVTANDYWILIGCKIGILLIAGVGVNILTGYTGLVSLGHAAFVAIGAYGTVILHNALDGIFPAPLLVFIAVPAAIAISAFVGIIVGLPSLRVKGLYLAVATLAANFIVIFLVEQDVFAPWTGGIVGVDTPVPNILGWQLDTEREMFVLIGFGPITSARSAVRSRGRAGGAIPGRSRSCCMKR